MSDGRSDQLYASQKDRIERFSFDDEVAGIFPDMIERSVPGYATIINMIGVLAADYARPGTRLFDLGCSLGAASLAMCQRVRADSCQIIAADNSPAMLRRARELFDASMPGIVIDLVETDICDLEITHASVVVLNFTLQFVPLHQRAGLIQRIAAGLCDGGILILSEKICFPNPHEEALQQSLHHAFKRNNGYSDLEISQKRTALENVLVPETLETHEQRLLTSGFSSVHVWFRCFNFMSLVAIR